MTSLKGIKLPKTTGSNVEMFLMKANLKRKEKLGSYADDIRGEQINPKCTKDS